MAVTGSAEDPSFLVCKRGDLLLVEREDCPSADVNWVRATNQRTNSSGAIYRDFLLFLPTLSRPSEDVLVPPTNMTKDKSFKAFKCIHNPIIVTGSKGSF